MMRTVGAPARRRLCQMEGRRPAGGKGPNLMAGTPDLDRGLLGHLFNGYSSRYTKKGLRGTPGKPDAMAAVPVLAE